jgi:alpha-L-fucosidase
MGRGTQGKAKWHQPGGKQMPVDMVIDLGRELNLGGFRYLPDQDRHAGVITKYQFFVSQDGAEWQKAGYAEVDVITE